MKKVSALVLVVIMICSVFCLSGCGEKTSITADQFKTLMEANGSTVVDVSEQFADYSEVTKVYVALLGNGDHQIEFYETDTDESATRLFAGNKSIFEDSIVNSSSHSSVSAANYNTYRLTADGYFKALTRIDNTMIFVNSPAEYKSEIKDILDTLGY